MSESIYIYNRYINGFIDANSGNINKRLWSFIKHNKKVYPQYMLMILYLQIIMKNQMPLTTIYFNLYSRKLVISTHS